MTPRKAIKQRKNFRNDVKYLIHRIERKGKSYVFIGKKFYKTFANKKCNEV